MLRALLLVAAASAQPSWSVGWGGLDPALQDPDKVRRERDEARAELSRCLHGEQAALQPLPSLPLPSTGFTSTLAAGAAAAALAALGLGLFLWSRSRAPSAGRYLNVEPSDLRAPLRGRREALEAAQVRRSWWNRVVEPLRGLRRRLAAAAAWVRRLPCWPSCDAPRALKRFLPPMPKLCKCSAWARFKQCGLSVPGGVASAMRAAASRCSSSTARLRKLVLGCCAGDDWDLEEDPALDAPVLWRQRAQSARQSLQKAQEQLERCLAEASQRVEESRRKAELAEAENARLVKQLGEMRARAESAEQLARKSRGEVEELKVSFKKAEETASRARQELQSARRRAEVAENIAARASRAQEDRGSRERKSLDLDQAQASPRTASPRPSSAKAASPSPSQKEKAGSQPGTPRQSAQEPPARANRRATAKARTAKPAPSPSPKPGSSTSSLFEEVTKDAKEFRRSSSGPSGSSAQARAEEKVSHEFSYNRALAMLKFTDTRVGKESAVPSATSSMQSLPGRVEEALQGLMPAAKSSKSASSGPSRFTKVPRLVSPE